MIGIYRIVIGEKSYIGSSTDVETRIDNHRKSLESGKNQNKSLQEAYNGEFEYEVLKQLSTDKDLESWESYYMGFYDSLENGYNNKISRRKRIYNIAIDQDNGGVDFLNSDQICKILNVGMDELERLIDVGMPYFDFPFGNRFVRKACESWIFAELIK